jgi:hypothetical protein
MVWADKFEKADRIKRQAYKQSHLYRNSDIMDKRMDLFGYEGLASPFLKKALDIFATEADCEISKVNCYIVKHKETIGLAFYNERKNIKNILLAKQLEVLGL